MVDCAKLHGAVQDYAAVVDELHGHYLDSTTGFAAIRSEIEATQAEARQLISPGEDVDELALTYGVGDPNDPSSRIQHRTTQGAFKARNMRGGSNYVRAAQLLIVLIYDYWESGHRASVARALGLSGSDELKVPILGDLRLLRQEVLHHQGVVQERITKRLSVIAGIPAAQELRLTAGDVDQVVAGVRTGLDGLLVQAGCPDPALRTWWRVQ
jgi:hypothetical protein